MPNTRERDGASIYYEQHGEAGDPVLLVMGLGGDMQFWEYQVPAFAARHRAFILDNRGAGRSDKPPGPYSTVQMADDAVAVLDDAKIERAHVVGLSMGGMIAQQIAIRHPARVGALVLAATYARADAGVRQVSEAGAAEARLPSPLALLSGGALDLRSADMSALFRFMMGLVLSPEFIQKEKEWLRSLQERLLASGAGPEQLLAQVAAVLSHDAVAGLSQVSAPTLVMTGTADRLVPPHHAEVLAELIPGAKLVRIEGGTHGFNIEMRDRFNKAVLDFLAEHPLAS
jgi:3-oxoadipate enol-lactonase